MPVLPAAAVPYRETRLFDEKTVPPGLLANHQTRPGVWGRLVVASGCLDYLVGDRCFRLTPEVDGVIAPEEPHRVRLAGPVAFKVVFLREP